MSAALTAALATLLMAAPTRADEPASVAIQRADGATVKFGVELATDTESRARGLMYRRKMPKSSGMLFLYDEPGDRAFWMKDTYIPLDMLFFTAGGELVYIHPNAKPGNLSPIAPRRSDICAILEINGGEAARRKLKIGDRLVLTDESACLPFK